MSNTRHNRTFIRSCIDLIKIDFNERKSDARGILLNYLLYLRCKPKLQHLLCIIVSNMILYPRNIDDGIYAV